MESRGAEGVASLDRVEDLFIRRQFGDCVLEAYRALWVRVHAAGVAPVERFNGTALDVAPLAQFGATAARDAPAVRLMVVLVQAMAELQRGREALALVERLYPAHSGPVAVLRVAALLHAHYGNMEEARAMLEAALSGTHGHAERDELREALVVRVLVPWKGASAAGARARQWDDVDAAVLERWTRTPAVGSDAVSALPIVARRRWGWALWAVPMVLALLAWAWARRRRPLRK